MAMLFESLPEFPPALADEDMAFLSRLCDCPDEQEVFGEDYTVCRRLERMGLVKVSRQKSDPDAMLPIWYAGKLPAAKVRAA